MSDMSGRLSDALDSDRRRELENVRAAAERIWSRPLHRTYTDHTVAHSERVIGLLDGLSAGMMRTDKRLSPTEVFVLLAAAVLHDIGMQDERYADGNLEDIRAHHHEQTAEMIFRVFEDPANAFNIPLSSDPGIVEAVALVAQGHCRVDLQDRAYDSFVHGGETVRLRLLAALLRFADALDLDHRRVDLELMKLLDLPLESQLHWWRCHYVSGVSIVDEYIRIAYRLPQERPDYEQLIVPLVETDIRREMADLEEIFRANAVKVALGKPQVRFMRAVQPLPPQVEVLAREWVAGGTGSKRQEAGGKKQGRRAEDVVAESHPPSRREAPTTIFDMRGQTVGTQTIVAGDYHEHASLRRPGRRPAAAPGKTVGEADHDAGEERCQELCQQL
ncbi:MAG: HD domain-containing protein, partial [Chloroflexi bacterium]|nr:HD domain-containing protein [Chloroflexota bacterium]